MEQPPPPLLPKPPSAEPPPPAVFLALTMLTVGEGQVAAAFTLISPRGDLSRVAPKQVGTFLVVENGVRDCGGGILSLKTVNGIPVGTEVLLLEIPPTGRDERRPADDKRATKGATGLAPGVVVAPAAVASEAAMTVTSRALAVIPPSGTSRATT